MKKTEVMDVIELNDGKITTRELCNQTGVTMMVAQKRLKDLYDDDILDRERKPCEGSGTAYVYEKKEATTRCEHCEGYGEIRTSSDMGPDWSRTCPKCGGTGIKPPDSKEEK